MFAPGGGTTALPLRLHSLGADATDARSCAAALVGLGALTAVGDAPGSTGRAALVRGT